MPGYVPDNDADRSQHIAEYLAYLQLRGLAEGTRREYGKTLRQVARWLTLCGADLVTADEEDLAAWRQARTVTDNTLLREVSTLRGYYRWLRKRAVLRLDDPTEDLILPRHRRGLPRPIGERDLEMAIDTAPARIRPWLVLAAYQGMRAGEIAYLQRQHVQDTADPPMILILGKGGKMRLVPMAWDTWTELLVAGLPRRGFLFLRRDGRPGPNTPGYVSWLANQHLHETCGLDNTLHSLRHRFGTVALRENGGNLRVVQELLGHASSATTDIYTQVGMPEAVATVMAVQRKRRLRAVRGQQSGR